MLPSPRPHTFDADVVGRVGDADRGADREATVLAAEGGRAVADRRMRTWIGHRMGGHPVRGRGALRRGA